MKRALILVVVLGVSVAAAVAENRRSLPLVSGPMGTNDGPLSTMLAELYAEVSGKIDSLKTAPEEVFDFSPAPGMPSFAEILAQTADEMILDCSSVGGADRSKTAIGIAEGHPVTKEASVCAFDGALGYCDVTYVVMTEKRAMEPVTFGEKETTKARLLIENVSRMAERYGVLETYRRIAGIEPPATERQ